MVILGDWEGTKRPNHSPPAASVPVERLMGHLPTPLAALLPVTGLSANTMVSNLIKKVKWLEAIFIFEILFFSLIITGILPRAVALYLAIVLIIYVLLASLEDAVAFFVRSIPLFLALPLTATFDNFNTWRIISAIIFLKWLWPKILNFLSLEKLETSFPLNFKLLNFKKYLNPKENPSILLIFLLLLAMLSIIPAPDKIVAIKRIIYFVNLSLIGIVIHDMFGDSISKQRLIKNIAIPIIIVTIVGFVQLASTYFIDIYQFMNLWGENIQCNQFGRQWCNIAVWQGNTWLAYYGPQLSLRMFSLFTDSHTFPMFILLGLPAIFAISLSKAVEKVKTETESSSEGSVSKLRRMLWIKARMSVIWIPLIFLAVILSGTRGIWVASIGVVLLTMALITYMKNVNSEVRFLNIFKYITLYLIMFFMLFAVAYPIFVSPQFLVGKSDFGLLGGRIKSIIDLEETSNSSRLEIWKKSLISIKNHPLGGVGIGNFPVVLNQDIQLAKAGSSAHNLYLHIAAEMGIAALIATLWFFWEIFKTAYKKFISSENSFMTIFYGACLLFYPWILIYLITDAALFDERAFLIFATIVALIGATKNTEKPDIRPVAQ